MTSSQMSTTETTPQQRSWRGVPLEARQAQRRADLLDAAFELLGSDGWRGTTVRGVCQAAHLNPRYFYENFDSLESLLIAVFDRLIVESTQTALRALEEAGADPVSRSVAVIGAVVRFVTEDPRRARVLFVEAQGNERMGRRRLDTLHATADFLSQYLWRQSGLADDRISLVASHLLVGGLTELVVTWLDGHLHLTLDELVDDAAALMVAVGNGAMTVAQSRTSETSRT
jgi:AcrR family transcriptional regulator